MLKQHDEFPLRPATPEILQINVGKLCNQTCAHCHVDAGPDRKTEQMSLSNFVQCLNTIGKLPGLKTVDITGGAPEMNPHFKWFIEKLYQLNLKIIIRSNLTVLVSNRKYFYLPEFFAEKQVNVVSSLPFYNRNRTDSQRGQGVFEDSIKALRMLNEVGYGHPESGLHLDLVHNPSGAYLPGSQSALEKEYKTQLQTRYGIIFNNLFTIVNLPISRFLDYLLQSGNFNQYMEALVTAFNPATVSGLMCRNTLSVSWEGYLYDCDFNQMLDLKVNTKKGQHIEYFDLEELMKREIVVNQHCYGCTAGAGSSCGGAISSE